MSIQEHREKAANLRIEAARRERIAGREMQWAKEDRADADLHDAIADQRDLTNRPKDGILLYTAEITKNPNL